MGKVENSVADLNENADICGRHIFFRALAHVLRFEIMVGALVVQRSEVACKNGVSPDRTAVLSPTQSFPVLTHYSSLTVRLLP